MAKGLQLQFAYSNDRSKSVTMTTDSSKNDTISLSHMNLLEYMGYVCVFRSMHMLGLVHVSK